MAKGMGHIVGGGIIIAAAVYFREQAVLAYNSSAQSVILTLLTFLLILGNVMIVFGVINLVFDFTSGDYEWEPKDHLSSLDVIQEESAEPPDKLFRCGGCGSMEKVGRCRYCRSNIGKDSTSKKSTESIEHTKKLFECGSCGVKSPAGTCEWCHGLVGERGR